MDERMAEWNKCTDPQCRECVEFRVIYGVSVVGELIDVGLSVGRSVGSKPSGRRTKWTKWTKWTKATPTRPEGASLYLLPITDTVNIHKS